MKKDIKLEQKKYPKQPEKIAKLSKIAPILTPSNKNSIKQHQKNGIKKNFE